MTNSLEIIIFLASNKPLLTNKMKQLVSILLLTARIFHITACETAAENIDQEIKHKIDDFIKNVFLPNGGISGLGLAIVQNDGHVLYTTGYGMANEEKGIPISNQTEFLIASVTKSFTATIVIKALSENFPDSANFTLIDRFRSEHGTFRDLLSHRMCLPGDSLALAAEAFNSTEEIVYRQRYTEEVCGDRTEMQYNNQMYLFAGELIGKLVNKTYDDLIEDFLSEIGMLNSSLGKTTDDFSSMPLRAQPYYVLDNATHPMNPGLVKRAFHYSPAGGLWSTPADMAKYLSFHLNRGKVGDKQIISASVWDWLKTPSVIAPVNHFKSSEDDIVIKDLGVGLGILRSSYDGWEYLTHGGAWFPYTSLFSIFPTQKLGIFSSTNQAPLQVNWEVLHSFIFETLKDSQNAPKRIVSFMRKEKAKKAEETQKQKLGLKNFLRKYFMPENKLTSASEIIGMYGSGSSGDCEIFEKFNPETNTSGLYLSYGKWAHGWLEVYQDTGGNDGGRSKQNIGVNLKIFWDTDIVQEYYAMGLTEGVSYARVYNETLEFIEPLKSIGKFKLGVS